jgi:hypothetical protein
MVQKPPLCFVLLQDSNDVLAGLDADLRALLELGLQPGRWISNMTMLPASCSQQDMNSWCSLLWPLDLLPAPAGEMSSEPSFRNADNV